MKWYEMLALGAVGYFAITKLSPTVNISPSLFGSVPQLKDTRVMRAETETDAIRLFNQYVAGRASPSTKPISINPLSAALDDIMKVLK